LRSGSRDLRGVTRVQTLMTPHAGAVIVLALSTATLSTATLNAQAWRGFAGDAQHTALSPVKSQALEQIRWHTPVDLAPQYSDGELFIHYGSPLVTAGNTVIVPVKTGADGAFRVEARAGADGTLIWSQTSDYVFPVHDWTPEFGPTLTPQGRLYFPGAGGTVYFRDSPDSPSGGQGQIVFYGGASYGANPSAYNASVQIDTPLTSDAAGNIYFGFAVMGGTPLSLMSGIARIGADGSGAWTSAASAAKDGYMTEVPFNGAPALSLDQRTLYAPISNGEAGYLVALNSTTLAPVARARLTDPFSGADAWITDNASSTPTVGPDGDVYYGVLENPVGANHERGWLLHFDATLAQRKIPGSFGWDDTASIVPASMVASYSGKSTYLVMTKYNDYINAGGTGLNRLAVLDPNAAQIDDVTGTSVMREVLTIAGPTPNGPPPAVKEWCINSAAVDPASHSILAGSEDGKLYRWDLSTNTLSETLVLTAGVGEAYTPTIIGPDGTVYAINNATLFAAGAAATSTIQVTPDALSFLFAAGAAPPPAQTLSITSAPSGAAVQVTAACAWLTASPTSGTTPMQTQITASIEGLAPGTYPCSLSVTGPGGAKANIRLK
jgi:hypothetical protein